MKFYTSILDTNQQEVFPKLEFLTKKGFYLAGGTALSLQIGHRTSVDFDFFVQDHFDSNELINEINKIFPTTSKVTLIEKDTVFVNINEIDCSFFWYQYPLIKTTEIISGVKLASLEDISAMKLLAVSHRPAKRDYIDIYYLLKKFDIAEMFTFATKKYKNFNKYLILRALTYYDDVEGKENKRPIKLIDASFSWDKAKEFITDKVKKYQLGMFTKK